MNGSLHEIPGPELRRVDRRAAKSRRSGDWGSLHDRLKLSEWLFHATSPQLTIGSDEPAHLTRTEYRILVLLALAPYQVITHDELMDAVADRGWDSGERGIADHIDSLRRKIDPDVGVPSLIRTVRGDGYMFVPARGSPRRAGPS